jgi:hypothetical protein
MTAAVSEAIPSRESSSFESIEVKIEELFSLLSCQPSYLANIDL